jgi:aminoglycoside phosphotransferase family enzyme
MAVSLENKVAFLRKKQSYPDKPKDIEVVETHMSWVFITTDFVYKLKKPVKINSLDYSTLPKRDKYCNAEVTLNRRLAPNVYLGVIPITLDRTGKLMLQGDGEVVEWLVKMRRLPIICMLDYKIQTHNVRKTDVVNIIDVLVKFYEEVDKIKLTAFDYCLRFKKAILSNSKELLYPRYQLPGSVIESIISDQLDFVFRYSELLAQRADANKIVDAHGDLRPEHICLSNTPTIIDCLEFSKELRTLDPVDELSFLSLECERLGNPLVANLVLDIYSIKTHDTPPLALSNFYKSHRACKRAKVAIRHLNDNLSPNQTNKWIQRSNDYLDIASKYTRGLNPKR